MAENLRIGITVDSGQANESLKKTQQQLAATAMTAQKADSSLQQLGRGAAQANTSLINLGRVVQDAPFGFIGIANNIDPLLGSFTQLRKETGSTGGALKALGGQLLGGGGLAFGVSVVTSLLVVFGDKLFGAGKKAKEAATAADEFKKAVQGINEAAAKEQASVLTLVTALNDENVSRREKAAALKQLQQINPKYFGDLKLEGDLVKGLSSAYQQYVAGIEKSIQNKIDFKNLEDVLLKINEENRNLERNQGIIAINQAQINDLYAKGGANYAKTLESQNKFLKNTDKLTSLERQRDEILKRIADRDFEGQIKLDLEKAIKEKKPKEIEDILRRQLNLNLLDIIPIEPDPSTLDRIFAAMNKSFQDVGNNKRIKPITLPVQVTADGFAAERRRLEEFGAEAAGIFTNYFQGAFEGVGEALGRALVGDGTGISGLFTNIANLLGESLKRLGQYIIQTSTLVASIRNALNAAFKGNSALGIAVGVGLIALGSAIQATLPQFANGVDNFRGGLAVVGERGPEIVNLPRGSDVIPNFRLNSLQASDGVRVVIPEVRLRGQDIYLSFTRQQATNRRNGV